MVEVTGYDEDIVFLIMPDESEFSRHVPLVLGTCTICKIINMIRESEIDRLSVPLATTQTSQWGAVGGMEEAQTLSTESTDKGIDEPILVKEHVKLGAFLTQILECKVKPLLGKTTLMMVCPIRVGKTQLTGMCPLHPGLHVLHTLTGKWKGICCGMQHVRQLHLLEEGQENSKCEVHIAHSPCRIV